MNLHQYITDSINQKFPNLNGGENKNQWTSWFSNGYLATFLLYHEENNKPIKFRLNLNDKQFNQLKSLSGPFGIHLDNSCVDSRTTSKSYNVSIENSHIDINRYKSCIDFIVKNFV